MHPYPHSYRASAHGQPTGLVLAQSPGLSSLETAPPPQFDGPEGYWSPETLLVAAVADCFILTFRAVARANGLAWEHLDCAVDASLDRVAGVAQFTSYRTTATLTVAAGTDIEKARGLLERAEKACLIANSLRGERVLDCHIVTSDG